MGTDVDDDDDDEEGMAMEELISKVGIYMGVKRLGIQGMSR